jgi:hypothetical protein
MFSIYPVEHISIKPATFNDIYIWQRRECVLYYDILNGYQSD